MPPGSKYARLRHPHPGAREHNLRDVDVRLPRNQLICLTGVSGSGKSSLAFDTLYAEGQRRYVESLSSFARQFLGQMPKPDVDFIGGLSPSISISQKSAGNNPRSTVGTITEIYDYLRVLYARVGTGHCPRVRPADHAPRRASRSSAASCCWPDKTKFAVLAPVVRGQKGEYRDLFEDLLKQGFVRARVDGRVVAADRTTCRSTARCGTTSKWSSTGWSAGPTIRGAAGRGGRAGAEDGRGQPDRRPRRSLMQTGPRPTGTLRRQEAAQRKAKMPGDIAISAHYACTDCGLSFEPPRPQLFSFNSPQGMCPKCDGLGEIYTFDPGAADPRPGEVVRQGLRSSWSARGRTWAAGGGTSSRGVADTMERKHELEEGTLLETPGASCDRVAAATSGCGAPATSTSRSPGGRGTSAQKYGGKFEGIIPELLRQVPQQPRAAAAARKLEKYMRVHRLPRLRRRSGSTRRPAR